jgi:DNA polymerase elongation subunit (family B)
MCVFAGIIAVSNLDGGVKVPAFRGTAQNCKITYVDDETALFHELVKCVRKWDPDILGGYEVIKLKIIYIILAQFLHSFEQFCLCGYGNKNSK